MILNDTSIRGLYLYDSTAEYEKGDFVVYGDCIYICTASNPTNTTNNTVTGIKPSEDLINFKSYPGDKISTIDEYYTFLKGYLEGKTYEVEDKFISSNVLCQILQKMYFGVDESGIIDNYVLYSKDANKIDCSVFTIKEVFDTTTKVLDKIILAPDLNNGIVKVSRKLPELETIFIQKYSESTNVNIADIVLLKQYTYANGINRYRVQELIDPVTGETFYRYAIGTVKSTDELTGLETYNYSNTSLSTWKTNLSGESNKNVLTTLDKINSIINNCSSIIEDYQNKFDSIKSAFKFSNKIENKNGILENIVSTPSINITLDNTKFDIITVLISDRRSKIYNNTSITINLNEKLDQKYFISKDIVLNCTVDKTTSSKTKLSFEYSTDSEDIPSLVYITDIYYRYNYND